MLWDALDRALEARTQYYLARGYTREKAEELAERDIASPPDEANDYAPVGGRYT